MDVILTGSIAYDYLMRFPGRFVDYFIKEQMHQVSLSFLVDEMTKHWGGNAANIAYTLALLGLRPHLMGTVGQDFADYRHWLNSVGVDTSTVRQIDDVFTASFFVNTDLDNNQIASFYTGAMEFARYYPIAEAYDGKPDLVVISPNDPQAMVNLAKECRENNIRFLYDPSQQVPRLDGEALREGIRGAYMMVVNAYEAEIISQKTKLSLDDMRRQIDILVITHGKEGSHIYLDDEIIEVEAFPPDEIKDPTGVGDAYRAGLIFGMSHNLPFKLAGELGAVCATYALEQVGTQSHHFTVAQLIERFRTHFEDDGLLDAVLTT